MTAQITILTTLGLPATKTLRRAADGTVEKVPMETQIHAKNFRWREESAGSIHELSTLLSRLERMPNDLVVRGVPKAGAPELIKRRSNGPTASIESHPLGQPWIMCDFDKVRGPVDSDMSWRDRVRWTIRTYLPACFHDVTCHYQWSTSAGLNGSREHHSLHVWFWLSRPVFDLSLKEWTREDNVPIDWKLFQPVQEHFTAAPILDGCDDPMGPERSGLLLAESDVLAALPGWLDGEQYTRRVREREDIARAYAEAVAAAASKVGPGDKRARRDRFAGAVLSHAALAIGSASEGNRHATNGAWAFSVGGWVGAGVVNESDALRVLLDASRGPLPKSRWADEERNIREALAVGIARPYMVEEVDAGDAAQELAQALGHRPPATAPAGRVLSGFDGGLAKVGLTVPDAPHPGHDVPAGYWLTSGGLGSWSQKEEGAAPKCQSFTPAAVVVAGRCVDVDDKTEHLLLAWPRNGRWMRRKLGRRAATGKGIHELAEHGFPVSEKDAPALGQYVVRYESQNIAAIPTMLITSSMGWQEESQGFVVGHRHFDMQCRVRDIDVNKFTDNAWPEGAIALVPPDRGEEQVAAACHAAGEADEWARAARNLDLFPRARLAVVASFVPPVLAILGAPGFVLEYACDTSKGKTTALRVGAAVWGYPDPDHAVTVVRSWDTTTVGLERLLSFSRNIPVYLDDTRRARFPETVPDTFYMVAQGQGRMRGSLRGSAASKPFLTVLVSTGELQTSSTTNKAGSTARTLAVTGNPFIDENRADEVGDLKSTTIANYGHHGPMFVQWLITQRGRWPEFRARWRQRATEWKALGDDGASGRLLENIATLDIVQELVEEALGLGLPCALRQETDREMPVWRELVGEVRDVVGVERAWDDLSSWFIAHRRHIKGNGGEFQAHSIHGVLGYANLAPNATCVGLHPGPIEELLKSRGHQPKVILRGWRERGWMHCDEENGHPRLNKRVRLDNGDGSPRLLVFDMVRLNGEHGEQKGNKGAKNAQ